MAQELTLDVLDDEGEVGLVGVPRILTLSPIDDEGWVGFPSIGTDDNWGPTESTPYPGEPGGSPVSGTDPSGLASPSLVLPESAVRLIEADGTHVAWLKDAKGWGWRKSKSDAGSGQVTLARSDPLAAQAVWPRELQFFDRAQPRQRAILGPRSDQTIDQQEESGETVEVSGPGALAKTARGTVRPIRLDLRPVQDSMRFTYAHPAYDASGWANAKNSGDYGRPTDWPGGSNALNITGPSGTHGFLPGGTYYLRGPSFTLDEDTDIKVVWHADQLGRVWLDGAEIASLETFDANNYLRTHESQTLRLSAGQHYPAASFFNQSSALPGPSGNPGFIRISFRALDANGQLGDEVRGTSTSWLCYEFPQVRPASLQRPGWTAGGILIYLLDQWEARGGPTYGRSFTETVDSKGAAWPNIVDFTATIGDLYAAIQALQEVHCDLDVAAGSDLMHAWVKDTRGTVTAVSLPDGYGDQVDGCLKGLSHTSEPPLVTAAMLRWRDAYVEVLNDDAITAGVYVERKIDVPLVNTEAAAERIGEWAVDIFGQERVQATADLRPRDLAQRPGWGFDVADTVSAPDRDLDMVPQVIQSWSHTADTDGIIRWQIEYGDLIFDLEERFNNALDVMTGRGTIGGRSFQPNAYRHEQMPESTSTLRHAVPFDHDAGDAIGESRLWTIDDHGTIEAVTVTIPGGEGGDFEVRLNGTAIWSATIGTDVSFTERELTVKVQPGDLLSGYSLEPIHFTIGVRIAA